MGVATVCTTGACDKDITAPGTEATVLVVKEEDATVVVCWLPPPGAAGKAAMLANCNVWLAAATGIWNCCWGARATCCSWPLGIIIIAIWGCACWACAYTICWPAFVWTSWGTIASGACGAICTGTWVRFKL